MDDFGTDNPPYSGTDRRVQNRIATMYKPVIVELDDFAGLCLMRNLSSSGMMGQIGTIFAKQAPVRVQLSQMHAVSGRIAWSEDGKVGISFDEAVDVAAIFADFSQNRSDGLLARQPRLPIRCKGTITLGTLSVAVEAINISQGGVKVNAECLCPEDEVNVRLDGLGARRAIVRWVQAGCAGLNFVQPLAFDELATWAVRRQASAAELRATSD